LDYTKTTTIFQKDIRRVMSNDELPVVPPLKPVRPWDLINPNKERVSEAAQNRRMEICKACPFFIKITGQCSKCGCIMSQKTKLADAYCPVDKWGLSPNVSGE
jgi:tRNA(Ile2) C34 agmatinyltransferase TiaS